MPKAWLRFHAPVMLALAAAVALSAFWWIGVLVGFPTYRGFNASLLIQPIAAAKVLAVTLGILLVTALCTFLAGRVRYDAGWACAALGLYALRLRGGPIDTTIRDQPPAVFVTLAFELLMLGIILGAAWGVLHVLRERGAAFETLRRVLELPDPTARRADRKASEESIDQKLLAVLVSAATMAVLMVILCRTTERTQTLFAVAISAYLATWTTHLFIPTRPAAWFWAGPIVCGVMGYLWAWWATPQTLLAIGQPGGFLAALARPLPLDYASVGVAAALWRYVQSRTHQMQQVVEAQLPEGTAPTAAAGGG